MISAEEIKALMVTLDEILAPKKSDERLGTSAALANSLAKVIAKDPRNTILTLQTLVNKAEKMLDDMQCGNNEYTHDEREIFIHKLGQYVTKEQTNDK